MHFSTLTLLPLAASVLATPSSSKKWGPDLANQPLPSLIPHSENERVVPKAPSEVQGLQLAFDPRVRHRQASICQEPGVCPMNVTLDCDGDGASRMSYIEFEHPQGLIEIRVLPGKKYCDASTMWTDPEIFNEMAVAFNGSYRNNVPKDCYIVKEKMGYAPDTFGQIAFCHWPASDAVLWHRTS